LLTTEYLRRVDQLSAGIGFRKPMGSEIARLLKEMAPEAALPQKS
jgi:hypothetical protein